MLLLVTSSHMTPFCCLLDTGWSCLVMPSEILGNLVPGASGKVSIFNICCTDFRS
jgi:hypothetical protein